MWANNFELFFSHGCWKDCKYPSFCSNDKSSPTNTWPDEKKNLHHIRCISRLNNQVYSWNESNIFVKNKSFESETKKTFGTKKKDSWEQKFYLHSHLKQWLRPQNQIHGIKLIMRNKNKMKICNFEPQKQRKIIHKWSCNFFIFRAIYHEKYVSPE